MMALQRLVAPSFDLRVDLLFSSLTVLGLTRVPHNDHDVDPCQGER